MIAVRWFDFEHRMERQGVLLQVTTMNEQCSKEHIAFVITTAAPADRCHVHDVKVGKTKIIIPINVSYLEVMGHNIPLFDDPVTS